MPTKRNVSLASAAYCPFTIFALILAQMGCSPATERQSSQPDSVKRNERSAGMPTLDGNWQVAAVDGRTIVGIALKGGNGALTWEPDCAGWWITYRLDGADIRFARKTPPAGELQVVCLIGFPDSLPAIFGLLPALDQIEASDGGNVRLTGDGHEIRLERPLSVADRPVKSLEGRWSVLSVGRTQLRKGSLVFTATSDFITWEPACAGQIRAYVIENSRILVNQPRAAPTPPLPPGVQAAPPPLACAIGLHPNLRAAFAAMEKATHVHPTGAGGITMEGNGTEVTLTPASG